MRSCLFPAPTGGPAPCFDRVDLRGDLYLRCARRGLEWTLSGDRERFSKRICISARVSIWLRADTLFYSAEEKSADRALFKKFLSLSLSRNIIFCNVRKVVF